MKVIHKYEGGITGHIELKLPVGSLCMDVNVQDGNIYAWVLHEMDTKQENAVIFDVYAYPTGQPIPPEHALAQFKTVHIPSDYAVMHYFYGQRPEKLEYFFFYAKELGPERYFHRDNRDEYYYECINGKHVKITDPQLGYDLVNTYTLVRMH